MVSGVSYIKIEEIGLSVRTYNTLKRARLNTVGDVTQMSDKQLRGIRNLGKKTFDEIKREVFDEDRVIMSITNEILRLEARLQPLTDRLADGIGKQELDPEKIKKYKALIKEKDGNL